MKGKTAKREREKSPTGGISVRAIAAVALVCALVLLQGGYYAGATCLVALVSTAAYLAWAFVRKERVCLPMLPLLICGLACVFLLSSLAHGASATELLETATWFSIAGMSLWCAFGSQREKREALEYLACSGAVLAVAGILMFFGVLPVEGSVSANRLMFTFQYANAAGLFFGIATVLCLCTLQGYRRIAAVLPFVALVLTKSAGAIIVLVAALVAVGVRWVRTEKPRRGIVVSTVAVAAAVCLAGALLLHDRFAQAASTFVERFVQVLDALPLLAGNPLLGIGPDQWQVVYPAVQTAQYRAADVHCSYMQVALDGGVLALALFVAFFVVGIVRLVKAGDFVSIVCAAMIAVHALVDFDLQFSSIALVACLVLAAPWHDGEAKGGRAHWMLCLGVAACALVSSIGGIYLDGQVGALEERALQGDGENAHALMEAKSYLRNDVLLRGEVAAALFFQGDYESVATLAMGSGYGSSTGEGTDSAASSSAGSSVAASTGLGAGSLADYSNLSEEIQLYYALSKLETGASAEGREALADVLYRHPYDLDLFHAAKTYLENATPFDGREACVAAYNEQAARANALAHEGHAAWIGKQEEIELIE